MKLDALRKRLRQSKPKTKATKREASASAKHKRGPDIVPVTGLHDVACSLCGGLYDPSKDDDRFFGGFSMCPTCDRNIVGPPIVLGDNDEA